MLFEVLPPDVKVDTSGVIQATLKYSIGSFKKKAQMGSTMLKKFIWVKKRKKKLNLMVF